jgi:hypothetical protein
MAYERLPKCRLCGWNCDPESGTLAYMGVHEINPETLREAWMHNECLDRALDRARRYDATKKRFATRYEQWADKSGVEVF